MGPDWVSCYPDNPVQGDECATDYDGTGDVDPRCRTEVPGMPCAYVFRYEWIIQDLPDVTLSASLTCTLLGEVCASLGLVTFIAVEPLSDQRIQKIEITSNGAVTVCEWVTTCAVTVSNDTPVEGVTLDGVAYSTYGDSAQASQMVKVDVTAPQVLVERDCLLPGPGADPWCQAAEQVRVSATDTGVGPHSDFEDASSA